MKWICTRCGTVNSKNFCKKCHGSKRRFFSEYKKPEKVKRNRTEGVEESKSEKIYRLISEAILVLHYLFLLVPVISIKGVNSTQTYSAFGMLYDLSLVVYIIALFALTVACVYFMEILPKMRKEVLMASMVVNVLSFSITPVLIIAGKFKGFSLTFWGVVYILITLMGELSLIKYYKLVFDGEPEEPEPVYEPEEQPVKKYEPKSKVADYYMDEEYKPIVNIPVKTSTVVCPMCGAKVIHGTTHCPKCNTLILRNAPSRDISSDSKRKY